MSVAELINEAVAGFGEFARQNPSLALGFILTGAGVVKGGKLGTAAFLVGLYFVLHNWSLDTVLWTAIKAFVGL